MSIKSKGRTYGRKVRRCTGLPLPICMKIGKMVAQGASAYQFVEKFPTYFKAEGWQCGDRCCGGTRYTLTGPKGSIEGDYGFDEEDIRKEYFFVQNRKNGEVVVYPRRDAAPDTVRTPPPPMSVRP